MRLVTIGLALLLSTASWAQKGTHALQKFGETSQVSSRVCNSKQDQTGIGASTRFAAPRCTSGTILTKMDALECAIAKAEGFFQRGTLPARYHNPGDLKSRRGLTPLPGQIRLGKAGHIVFKTDADGWTALRNYYIKAMDGESRHFRPTMSLTQVSRVYAQRWRPWLRIVTKELAVAPTTTLADFLQSEESEDVWPNECLGWDFAAL